MPTVVARSERRRAGAVFAALLIGLGLVAAPLAFSMFDRAPSGGDMIDDFKPFMTSQKLAQYRGFIAEIRAAEQQTGRAVDPVAAENLGLSDAAYKEQLALLADFEQQWPAIDADMSDMLDTMQSNLANFDGVAALPPFPLFPFFFLLPGIMIAVIAALALRARSHGRAPRRLVIAIAVLGIGLVAAPAIFQMFSRAPGGREMIDDFRPLMTRKKVTTIQGYFLTIGNGEAQIRNDALPAADLETGSAPAVERFSEDWPTINSELSPMVGTMADNLDNYADVDALPRFDLFPWFFVAPGLALIGLALAARASRGSPADDRVAPMFDVRSPIHQEAP